MVLVLVRRHIWGLTPYHELDAVVQFDLNWSLFERSTTVLSSLSRDILACISVFDHAEDISIILEEANAYASVRA